MDLLEKTRLIIDILNGTNPDELAEDHGLDPDELQGWLRTFLEAGVAALAGDMDSDSCVVVPLFREKDPEEDGGVLRRVK